MNKNNELWVDWLTKYAKIEQNTRKLENFTESESLFDDLVEFPQETWEHEKSGQVANPSLGFSKSAQINQSLVDRVVWVVPRDSIKLGFVDAGD